MTYTITYIILIYNYIDIYYIYYIKYLLVHKYIISPFSIFKKSNISICLQCFQVRSLIWLISLSTINGYE